MEPLRYGRAVFPQRLYLDQQAIDTTTPAGKLMFQVTGAFAEFERSTLDRRWNETGAPCRLRADADGPRPGCRETEHRFAHTVEEDKACTPGRAAMTPQEQELVTELFDRLAELENDPRDPDAERSGY